jgi:hypothetical protein
MNLVFPLFKTVSLDLLTIFLTTLDVAGKVDFFWQFRNVYLETILNLIQDFGVSFIRNKGYGQTLKTICKVCF